MHQSQQQLALCRVYCTAWVPDVYWVKISLFMPPLAIENVCVCSWLYTKCSLAWYVINRLWKFHQIYNWGAVGDKDELIACWGQRSKVQVSVRPNALLYCRHTNGQFANKDHLVQRLNSSLTVIDRNDVVRWSFNVIHCVTLTFAERNRLALSLSGNNPLSAN